MIRNKNDLVINQMNKVQKYYEDISSEQVNELIHSSTIGTKKISKVNIEPEHQQN